MRRTLAALSILALFAAAPALSAQDTGDHTRADQSGMATSEGMPDGWMMRFDRSNAGLDQVNFRTMEPGWHVNTGRAGAAIFWRPDMMAHGEYTLATQMHLFSPASHAEAFGLFMAGEELGGAGQGYVYFLVRQTGEFLIKRRLGPETETIVGWTAHDAIPEMAPGAEEPTEYNLAVECGADDVMFKVNGITVHTMARSDVDTEGRVGIRVNHMLDLHIQTVELHDGMGM